jgi:hypothetical protein
MEIEPTALHERALSAEATHGRKAEEFNVIKAELSIRTKSLF